MRIWLTGGSGSGKSTAATVFAKNGFIVVDADKIAREILLPGREGFRAVQKAFPTVPLQADGTIDRRYLASLVFGNPANLSVLNACTHPYIIQEILRQSAAAEHVVIDAPLPNTFGVPCDCTLALCAPRNVRIERIMARDGITRAEAENRIDAQEDDDTYCQSADAVFYNDSTEAALAEKVQAWILERKAN
ncbi:MAG: dephospho-CoA kinase [Clostridia bacterium]|nr:dephospho-CoA kinase [Clostridia bacterium]